MSQRASRKAKTAAADFFKRVIGGKDLSAELPSRAKLKAAENKSKGSDSKSKTADAKQKTADAKQKPTAESKGKPSENKGKAVINKKSVENKQITKPSEPRSNTRSTNQNKDGSSTCPAQASPRAKNKSSSSQEVKVIICKTEIKVTGKTSPHDHGGSVQAKRSRAANKSSDLDNKVIEEGANKGAGRRGKKVLETKDVQQTIKLEKNKNVNSPIKGNIVVGVVKVSEVTKPALIKTVGQPKVSAPREAATTRSPKPKLTPCVEAASRSPKVKVIGGSGVTTVCQKVISMLGGDTKVSSKCPKITAVHSAPSAGNNKIKTSKKAADKIVYDKTMPKLEREEPIVILNKVDIKLESTSAQLGDKPTEGLRSLLDDATYQNIIRSSSRSRRLSSPENRHKSSHSTPIRKQTKSLLSSLHKSKERPYRHTLLSGNQTDCSPPHLSPKISPQNQFLHLLSASPRAQLLFTADGDCEDREMPVLLPEPPLDAAEQVEEQEECVRRVPKHPIMTPELPSVLPNDKPVCLPGDVFTQCQFYATFGLIKKTELKIVTGKENKLHRTAGGRLRRTIKPRICPEMVSDFVLTKSGAVQDSPAQWQESSSNSGSEDEAGNKKTIVKHTLKPPLLKPEDLKRLQLSPKMVAALTKSKEHVAHAACKSVSAPSTPEKRALALTHSKVTLTSLDKFKCVKPDPSTSRKLTFDTRECPKNKKKEFPKPSALTKHSNDPGQSKTTCASGKVVKDTKVVKSAQGKQYIKQLDGRIKPSADTKCKYHANKLESKSPDKKKSLQNKSKSFENKSKSTSLQVKSKSFDSRLAKSGPSTRAVAKLKEEEEDDGTRRSARQRGAKRKQWWHLLRANPDEFEVDKQWDEEQAEKVRKKNEREERKAEEQRDDEDEENEEEPGESEDKEEVKGELQTGEKGKEGKEKDNKVNSESNNKAKKAAKRKAEGSPGQSAKKIKIGTELELKKEVEEKTASKKKKKRREIVEKIDVMSSVLTMCVSGHNKAFQFMSLKGAPLLASQNPGLFEGLKEILPWLARETDKLLFHGAVEYPVKRCIMYASGSTNGTVLSYKDMESQCVTPHMCPICWINDHMYCRNMRRTARDLVPNGGCLHYIPCRHYKKVCHSKPNLQPGSLSHGFDVYSPDGSDATSVTIRDGHLLCKRSYPSPTCESPMQSQRPSSLPSCVTPKPPTPSSRPPETPEDLYCHEQLVESDPEPNSPPTPAGTESLRVQLKARAIHLARSMGIADQDLMESPINLTLAALSSPNQKSAETTPVGPDVAVEPEEYGAEFEVWDGEPSDPDDLMVALLQTSNQTEPQEVRTELPQPDQQEPQQQIWLRLALYEMNISKPYFTFVDEKKYRYFRVTVELLENPSGVSKLEKPAAACKGKGSKAEPVKRPLSPDERGPKKKKKKDVEDDGSNSTNSATPSVSSDVIEGSQDSQGTFTSEPCSTASGNTDANGLDLSSDDSDTWDSDLDAESCASLDMVSQNEDGSYKPVFRPIQIHSHVTRLPSTLRREVTSGSDGSQMLQFSTKDIREHKPELLAYIKRAGLVGVIAKALSQEKTTLLKLIQEGEQQLSELHDYMEQNRCLLIAVQSEIKSVQDEILTVQKSMLQDESQSVRIRKHVKQMESHHTDTQKRLNLCQASLKYLGVVEESTPDTPSNDATAENSLDNPPEKPSSPDQELGEETVCRDKSSVDLLPMSTESTSTYEETAPDPETAAVPESSDEAAQVPGDSSSGEVSADVLCTVECPREVNEEGGLQEGQTSTVLDAGPAEPMDGLIIADHMSCDIQVTEDGSGAVAAEALEDQSEDCQGQQTEAECPTGDVADDAHSESSMLTDSVTLNDDGDGDAEIINIVVTRLPDGVQTEGESGTSSPVITHLVVTENEREEDSTDLIKDAMTAAFVEPETTDDWIEESTVSGAEASNAANVDEDSCSGNTSPPPDIVSYVMVAQAGPTQAGIVSITAVETDEDSRQSGEEPTVVPYAGEATHSNFISLATVAASSCSPDPAETSTKVASSRLEVSSPPRLTSDSVRTSDSTRTTNTEVVSSVLISDGATNTDTDSPSPVTTYVVQELTPESYSSHISDCSTPLLSEPTELVEANVDKQSDSQSHTPLIDNFLSVLEADAVAYSQPDMLDQSAAESELPVVVVSTHIGIDYSSLVLTSHPVTTAGTETVAASGLKSQLMGPVGSHLPYLEDSMDVEESGFPTDPDAESPETPVESYHLVSPAVDMTGLLPQVHSDIDYPTSFGLLGPGPHDFPPVIVEQEPSSKSVHTLAIGEDSGLGSSQETGESLF